MRRARATHLAKGPTAAYAGVKQSIRESWEIGQDDQLTLEARLQWLRGGTRDFKEGVVAFLDKRPAKFEER